FSLKLAQKLAYLFNPLVHVAQNSTPEEEKPQKIGAATLAEHDSSRKPVEALYADGLQCESAKPRIVRHLLQAAASALDIASWIFCFDDLAMARDVVHDDDAATMRELDGPIKIMRVVIFISIDEDEVERTAAFFGKHGKAFKSR